MEFQLAIAVLVFGIILGVIYAYSKSQTEVKEEETFFEVQGCRDQHHAHNLWLKSEDELRDTAPKEEDFVDLSKVKTPNSRYKSYEQLATDYKALEAAKKVPQKVPQKKDYCIVSDKPRTVIRILPPVKGGNYFTSRKLHYGNGVKPVVCSGSQCPICQWAETLKKCNQYSEYQRVKPVNRYYYNVIDRSTGGTPKILSCGRGLQEIIEDHLSDGRTEINSDLVVIRNMKSGFPCYEDSYFRDAPFSLEETITRFDAMKDRWDLEQVVTESTPEETESLLDILRDKFTRV